MKILCVASLLLAWPALAQAEEPPTLSLMVENDSFIDGVDRHYTNGLYASWTSAPEDKSDLDALAENLMLPGDGAWRHGWFGGQSIFTPEYLAYVIPPANDRPYAGWLYGGARLYRDSGDTLDRIEATLGVVGPASLGANVQLAWHSLGMPGTIHPNGWHYQLRNEPGLVLSEQRIWRVNLADGPLEAELLPEANVSLGNVFTYAGAGASLRIGSGLKSDWGPPRIAPGLSGADFQSVDTLAWYLYAGFEGRAVARNIFLDGNSFEDSARVGNKELVGDLNAGAALLLPGVRALASYTHRSPEFRGQRDADQFAAITLSFAN